MDPVVLIVDDNEDNRFTLSMRLENCGYYNLVTAGNGREALEKMRSGPVDLVLLDIMMPELDGYGVLAEMRADVALRDIPVVMISVLEDINSVVRCIELGAEDYLPKPFNPTLLKARVGASLEKKRLRDELEAHVARIEAELDSARLIQLSMVPCNFPAPTVETPVSIFASLYPARQVGGDLYDFFYISPTKLCVVVADISGKGAAAALFMARTKTLLRTLSILLRGNADTPEPHEVVTRMNAELCEDNPYSMFSTVFLATIDLLTREVHYCNCGHPRPYVVSADGVSELQSPRATPLGIRPAFAYKTTKRPLRVGDCLFLFTDGVTEAMDENDEQFSEARLEEVLRSVAAGSTQSVVTSVVEAVRRFAGHAPQSDDIAALAVRLVG